MKRRPATELAATSLVHLRRIYHAIRAQSSSIEATLGITSAQLWALHVIASAPDGLAIGDVADQLGLHKANATRFVERLVEKELVARERGKRDRRVVIVHATPAGLRALGTRVPPPAQLELLEKLSKLPPERAREIERALATIVRLLGAEAVEPRSIVDRR